MRYRLEKSDFPKWLNVVIWVLAAFMGGLLFLRAGHYITTPNALIASISFLMMSLIFLLSANQLIEKQRVKARYIIAYAWFFFIFGCCEMYFARYAEWAQY